MLEGIHENSMLIEQISHSTVEQSSALREVTTAVKQVDEMTQHNAALVEETNAAIEQTEGQAQELDRIVDVFVVDDARADPALRMVPARPPAPTRPQRATSSSAARTYLSDGNAALKESEWTEF
jgi:methyl-accepting chemotaxis protein